MSRKRHSALAAVATSALAISMFWSSHVVGLSATARSSDRSANEQEELHAWTERERRSMQSLVLRHDATTPADPSNAVSADRRAIELGEALFFDPRLSASGEVSCASCHRPEQYFSDGLKFSQGIEQTTRHAPGLLGVGFNAWFYWDGRRDSLWAQALVPIEAAGEMGGSRSGVVALLREDPQYREAYENLFGKLPGDDTMNRVSRDATPVGAPEARRSWTKAGPLAQREINEAFSNAGKAIAAYERTLMPGRSRFDEYAQAVASDEFERAASLMKASEVRGLRLFLDESRTRCMNCHNGPMFSNFDFQNVGTGKFEGGRLDFGRAFAVPAVLVDEFNCLSEYSDAKDDGCEELRFVARGDHSPIPIYGAFKVPGLRNVAKTAPYMHDGRFATLREVLDHYRSPPELEQPHELVPLDLSDDEMTDLIAFLSALSQPSP